DRGPPLVSVARGPDDPLALDDQPTNLDALAQLGVRALEHPPQQIVEVQARDDVAGLVPEAATDPGAVGQDRRASADDRVGDAEQRVAGLAELVDDLRAPVGDRVA